MKINKKGNMKIILIIIISVIIVGGILIWGFVTDWKFFNTKKKDITCVNDQWKNDKCKDYTYIGNKDDCNNNKGGIFTAGTNTSDQTCVTCGNDQWLNDNKCNNYSKIDYCDGERHIFTAGTKNSDQTCVTCGNDQWVNGNKCDDYTWNTPSCQGPDKWILKHPRQNQISCYHAIKSNTPSGNSSNERLFELLFYDRYNGLTGYDAAIISTCKYFGVIVTLNEIAPMRIQHQNFDTTDTEFDSGDKGKEQKVAYELIAASMSTKFTQSQKNTCQSEYPSENSILWKYVDYPDSECYRQTTWEFYVVRKFNYNYIDPSVEPSYRIEIINGDYIYTPDPTNPDTSYNYGPIKYFKIDSEDLSDMFSNYISDEFAALSWRRNRYFDVIEDMISNFNEDISGWDVSKVKNMKGMFSNKYTSFKSLKFNRDLREWDVSNVTDMEDMFKGTTFNGDISKWDVSNVTNMKDMFKGTTFNRDIHNWNVSNVTDMENMFQTSAFNKDVSIWDVSASVNTTNMFTNSFENCYKIRILQNPLCPLTYIPDRNVLDALIAAGNTDGNFQHNSGGTSGGTYNLGPIRTWILGKSCKDLSYLFDGRTDFNEDISGWDVSNVTNMKDMFHEAESFNQPLNEWDVSKVRTMEGMFDGAILFNQPLNNWDVSEVTSMRTMFQYAKSFNQPIGKWTPKKVKNMNHMFNGFNIYTMTFVQDLNSWCPYIKSNSLELFQFIDFRYSNYFSGNYNSMSDHSMKISRANADKIKWYFRLWSDGYGITPEMKTKYQAAYDAC